MEKQNSSIGNWNQKYFTIEFFHCTIMSSLSSMFLAVLGLLAILDGQNGKAVQWETEIKKCLGIQPNHCKIMSSLSSMFLGGLGSLGAASCFGWTKCESSSIENGNKTCFVIQHIYWQQFCHFLQCFWEALVVLGMPAVLDAQNSIHSLYNNAVTFFNVPGWPWRSWSCRLFRMDKIWQKFNEKRK